MTTTQTFKDILSSLEDISHVQQLVLSDTQGDIIDTIDNVPGKSGSVSVYYHVSHGHREINPSSAQQALQLYAEHVEDARQHPGKHPNIDRLFNIIENNLTLQVKTILK